MNKKSIFFLIFTFSFLSCFPQASAPQELENPRALGENRERAHASSFIYADIPSALLGLQEGSPFYLSLNGKWFFNWASKPADRPTDFFKSYFPINKWKTIDVPGNWEMQITRSM